MNLKTTLLMGTLIGGFTCILMQPAFAQSVSTPSAETSTLGANLKLNETQRQVIEQVSEFAFDQIEAMISSGFDPKKVDRTDLTKRVESLRQQVTSTRFDDDQLAEFRNIVRSAREQVQKQLETNLPVKP